MASAAPHLPAGPPGDPMPCPAGTTPDTLLADQAAWLARIKLAFGADQAAFTRVLMPLLRGYARFVHRLPATADGFFAQPGGLLQLGLETAFYALQGTDAHIFSGGATISERVELEPRWRLATFIGGLCSELHRAVGQVLVTSADGQAWAPWQGPLADWIALQPDGRCTLHWRANVQEARGLGLFALPHVLPGTVLQHLGQADTGIVPQLLASIAGTSLPGPGSMLDGLVRRAFALVVHRDLMQRRGTVPAGDHLARYLLHAMRQLAAGQWHWRPNHGRSRVWWGLDGLYLVWPGAAVDVLALLASEQLQGMPQHADAVLAILQAAGLCQTQALAGPVWHILPPGTASPVPAIRLASPALLLAGLVQDGEPLADRLAVGPAPAGADAGCRATPPAPACARDDGVGRDSGGAATQLCLLDAAAPTAGPHATAAAPPPATAAIGRPVARLRAPMRLHPAVHTALSASMAATADPATADGVQRTAEGVFVPFTALQRHGVQPAVAVRALRDARMLARSTEDTPTGGTPLGVVLRAEFFQELAPGPAAGTGPAAPGGPSEASATTA